MSLSSPVISPLRPVTPVGLAAQALDEVGRQLDALPEVPPETRAGVRRARDLVAGLDPYLEACTTPDSLALQKLAERTRATDWTKPLRAGEGEADAEGGRVPAPRLEAEMLSGHVEGQLLKLLVHATQAQRVLEIGMFTGYSALAMAEALPDDGAVIACEVSPRAAAIAGECFAESPHGAKISVRVGPALETLSGLTAAGASFDLVFVDADKANYVNYLDAVLTGELLAPHGLICVDNTLLQGQPYLDGPSTENGAAIAAFNRSVAADPRVEQVLIPVRDGLTLIRRV